MTEMGMTESEALLRIKDMEYECMNSTIHYYTDKDIPMLRLSEKALEEIQQYRAIGTVEELQKLKLLFGNENVEISELTTKILKEYPEYLSTGTIEEFKALKVENEELHCEIQAINATMDLLENEIRAKAIDEFAEKLSLEVSESIIWDMLATMSKNSSLSDTSDEIVDYVINTANEIAERLKVGGENG